MSLAVEKVREQNRKKTAAHRARYANNPEFKARVKAQAKRWAQENPERRKAIDLKRHFGMSLEQFNAMREAQHGLCGICVEPTLPGKDTCVDHDHRTGLIRKLLCRSCNTLLGRLEKDPNRLAAALAYLQEFQCH